MNDNVPATRADLAVLRGEFSTLRGEFSTLRGEVSTLRGEVTTIRDEVRIGLGPYLEKRLALLDAHWDARFERFTQEMLAHFRQLRSDMLAVQDEFVKRCEKLGINHLFLSDRVTQIEQRVSVLENPRPQTP